MGNPYIIFGAGVLIDDKDSLYHNVDDQDKLESSFGLGVDNNEENIYMLRIAGETEGSSYFIGNFISRVEIGCAIAIDSKLENKARELIPNVKKQLIELGYPQLSERVDVQVYCGHD